MIIYDFGFTIYGSFSNSAALVNRKSSILLHPHDLVAAIHVNRLAGDGRRAVAR